MIWLISFSNLLEIFWLTSEVWNQKSAKIIGPFWSHGRCVVEWKGFNYETEPKKELIELELFKTVKIWVVCNLEKEGGR